MGVGKVGGRKRAVGTRDRVMAHLLMTGDVTDPSGLASTVPAEAVGYPGSSVAFAQLLSGMERSGLIKREVRGKRTYRITPDGACPDCGTAIPGRWGRQFDGQIAATPFLPGTRRLRTL